MCPPFATSLAWICSLFRASWPCLGCSGSPVGLSVPRLLGMERAQSEALETSAEKPELAGWQCWMSGWLTCFFGHRNSWYICYTRLLVVAVLFRITFSLFYNVIKIALYSLLCRAGKEVISWTKILCFACLKIIFKIVNVIRNVQKGLTTPFPTLFHGMSLQSAMNS